MLDHPQSIHLLVRRPNAPAPSTGCGAQLSARDVLRRRTTHVPIEAACYRCAKETPGLGELERQVIWDNRNEQLQSFRPSPWEMAKRKAKKAEERAAKKAARAAKLAAKAERRAARKVATPF